MYRLILIDTITGVEYSDQKDFDIPLDIEHTFAFNKQSKIYTITLQNEINIHGNTFNVIWNTIKQGFDRRFEAILSKDIEGKYVTIFDGFFFISDANFNPMEYKCTIQLSNDDWQAYIDSGWDMLMSLDTEFTRNSKEGAEITFGSFGSSPAVSFPLGSFTLYDKQNSYTSTTFGNIIAWDIVEVFRTMIEYLSDGNIRFYSQWYLDLPVSQKVCLTSGLNLRTGTVNFPLIKFSELYKHLSNLYSVQLYFKIIDGVKYLRLETKEYISNNGILFDNLDIQTVNVYVDQSVLYSTIKAGSSSSFSNNSEINDKFCFPIVRGSSFAVEEFNVQNDVAVRNTLDISLDWIIDHNVLEDIRINDNKEYDNDIILIHYNSSTLAPVKSNIFNIAQLTNNDGFYNEIFVNSEVIKRRGDLFGNIVLHSLDSNDKFIAFGGTGLFSSWNIYQFFPIHTPSVLSTQEYAPVRFLNDNATGTDYYGNSILGKDVNNRYGNTTNTPVSQANSFYTVPSNGIYSLRVDMYYYIKRYVNNSNYGKIYLQICKGSYASPTVLASESYVFRIKINTSLGIFDIEKTSFGSHYNYGVLGYDYQEVDIASTDPFNDTTFNILSPIHFNFFGTVVRNIYLDTADEVWVRTVFEETDGNDANIYPTAYKQNLAGFIYGHIPFSFACTKAVNGGNTYIVQGQGSPDVYVSEYEVWMNDNQIQRLLKSSISNNLIQFDNGKIKGVNENIVVNHKTNICKFVSRSVNIV
jgi:hypothetical protein